MQTYKTKQKSATRIQVYTPVSHIIKCLQKMSSSFPDQCDFYINLSCILWSGHLDDATQIDHIALLTKVYS